MILKFDELADETFKKYGDIAYINRDAIVTLLLYGMRCSDKNVIITGKNNNHISICGDNREFDLFFIYGSDIIDDSFIIDDGVKRLEYEYYSTNEGSFWLELISENRKISNSLSFEIISRGYGINIYISYYDNIYSVEISGNKEYNKNIIDYERFISTLLRSDLGVGFSSICDCVFSCCDDKLVDRITVSLYRDNRIIKSKSFSNRFNNKCLKRKWVLRNSVDLT